MGYTQAALEDKILEMYPEIRKNNYTLALGFDAEKNAWIVKLQKGRHKRYAYLDKKDADSCMDGTQCIYLGFLIGQYMSDIEQEVKADL